MRKIFIGVITISFLIGGCSGEGERVGAICNDGSRSYATGQGACSHHGGVDYWIYENQ